MALPACSSTVVMALPLCLELGAGRSRTRGRADEASGAARARSRLPDARHPAPPGQGQSKGRTASLGASGRTVTMGGLTGVGTGHEAAPPQPDPDDDGHPQPRHAGTGPRKPPTAWEPCCCQARAGKLQPHGRPQTTQAALPTGETAWTNFGRVDPVVFEEPVFPEWRKRLCCCSQTASARGRLTAGQRAHACRCGEVPSAARPCRTSTRRTAARRRGRWGCAARPGRVRHGGRCRHALVSDAPRTGRRRQPAWALEPWPVCPGTGPGTRSAP
jgi:hypothetical protein